MILIPFLSCIKDNSKCNCDLSAIDAQNAKKVSITQGIWGTIGFMEGDCMNPSNNSCIGFPVKRDVIVYKYTMQNEALPLNAYPPFYDSLTTAKVAETVSDDDGFYQLKILPGKYTLTVVENGKLYINVSDGQNGLNPIAIKVGTQQANLTLTYKAYF